MTADVVSRLNAALEGRYAVEAEVGQGGMATVYRARDLRHNRNVALKVLKPELAAVVGAERFLSEIETTAGLQHPHILPLYDSGQADGFLYYVMPFVEGETLRDRLDAERQLPVAEALGITTAVAAALDFAHARGVVHRDIKPGNILFQAGQPVVGDFGIALAVGAAGGHRLTETGLSLGTPYYMSPEQATGDQKVGPRSDVYSLGCVLYEMLVGDPPFMGSTAQAVLGQIISGGHVHATERRPSVPANVDAAILKALEKVAADRFASAGELAAALADPGFRHGGGVAEAGGADGARRWKAVAAVSAVVAAAALGWAASASGAGDRVATRRYRIEMPRPAEQILTAALSPDGSLVGWVLWDSLSSGGEGVGESRIWLQSWNGLEPGAVPNTEGAGATTFSPDGRRLAFMVEEDLKVLALDDGGVRTIAPDAGFRQVAWGDDGYIYAGFNSTSRPTIVRLPETGGAVESVTDTVLGRTHRGPSLLPGGRAVLFTSSPFAAGPEGDSVGILDLGSGEQRILGPGVRPWFSPPGHLVWRRGDQLVAAPFDPDALEMKGPPEVIMGGVIGGAASDGGSMLVVLGSADVLTPGLRWVHPDGTRDDIDWAFRPGPLPADPALSPDGSRLAVSVVDENGVEQIHVRNLLDGTAVLLGPGVRPAWSSDGREVGYRGPALEGEPEDQVRLYRRRADGSGPRLPISAPMLPTEMNLGRWSLDQPLVHGTPEGLAVLVPGQDTVATLLMEDDVALDNPTLSPDGRWLALTYEVTGERRVFVRPYPDVGSALHPVSVQTAGDPQWSRDGRTLYYITEGDDRDVMAARLETEAGFRVVSRESLGPYQEGGRWNTGGWLFDVGGGDERVLVSWWDGGDTEFGGLVLVESLAAEMAGRAARSR